MIERYNINKSSVILKYFDNFLICKTQKGGIKYAYNLFLLSLSQVLLGFGKCDVMHNYSFFFTNSQ